MATINQITADPRFLKASPEQRKRLIARADDAPQSFKEQVFPVIEKGLNEALMRPGTITRDVMSDPVTQAKALPVLAGTAAAGAGIPMGATIGAVGGRQLSNLALKTYGKSEEIPSGAEQALEAVLSVGGDLTAIPAINRARFGAKIGEAERAAGVITRPPDRLPTAGNVGEYLNTLESQLDTGAINTPQVARDAYAGTKYINKNPNLVGKSDEINVASARVGRKASEMLNSKVPGRKEAAESLRMSQRVPNAIRAGYDALPGPLKYAIERYAIPLTVVEEIIRHTSGGKR